MGSTDGELLDEALDLVSELEDSLTILKSDGNTLRLEVVKLSRDLEATTSDRNGVKATNDRLRGELKDLRKENKRLRYVELEARRLVMKVRAEHNGWDQWCESFQRAVLEFLGWERDREALKQLNKKLGYTNDGV